MQLILLQVRFKKKPTQGIYLWNIWVHWWLSIKILDHHQRISPGEESTSSPGTWEARCDRTCALLQVISLWASMHSHRDVRHPCLFLYNLLWPCLSWLIFDTSLGQGKMILVINQLPKVSDNACGMNVRVGPRIRQLISLRNCLFSSDSYVINRKRGI